MSTRVMVEDTPDARFMTDESSTTLPFRFRGSSGWVSLLDRGADIDDCEECVERLPECDLSDLSMDLRAWWPFSGPGTGGAEAGNGGVIAGIGETAGDGVREGG